MPGNRCSNCIAYSFECTYIEAAKVCLQLYPVLRIRARVLMLPFFSRNEVLQKGMCFPVQLREPANPRCACR